VWGTATSFQFFLPLKPFSGIVKFTLVLMLSCGQRSALSTGETRTLSDELENATVWIRLYEETGDAGLVCRRCGISRQRCGNGGGVIKHSAKLRFPIQSGHRFRLDPGHRTDLMPATIPK